MPPSAPRSLTGQGRRGDSVPHPTPTPTPGGRPGTSPLGARGRSRGSWARLGPAVATSGHIRPHPRSPGPQPAGPLRCDPRAVSRGGSSPRRCRGHSGACLREHRCPHAGLRGGAQRTSTLTRGFCPEVVAVCIPPCCGQGPPPCPLFCSRGHRTSVSCCGPHGRHPVSGLAVVSGPSAARDLSCVCPRLRCLPWEAPACVSRSPFSRPCRWWRPVSVRFLFMTVHVFSGSFWNVPRIPRVCKSSPGPGVGL